ncbi:hypothetical protein TNCV_4026111 [Trichonephila clavipes]|nr:hypothetical protein TNCV_4026111 [Trichonephila clavipes]
MQCKLDLHFDQSLKTGKRKSFLKNTILNRSVQLKALQVPSPQRKQDHSLPPPKPQQANRKSLFSPFLSLSLFQSVEESDPMHPHRREKASLSSSQRISRMKQLKDFIISSTLLAFLNIHGTR